MALNLFIYFHCVKSLSWSVKTLDTLNMLKLIKKFLLFDLVMAKESLIVMKSHVQKVATNIWIWKKEDVLKMNAFVKMIMMLLGPQWYFFKNLFQNDYMILIWDHPFDRSWRISTTPNTTKIFLFAFKLIQQSNMVILSCLAKKNQNLNSRKKSSVFYWKGRFAGVSALKCNFQ